MIKPTDLRGILEYVPQWRGHTFVIALDGAIAGEDSSAAVYTDIAVLMNLGVKVVLVYGIGDQLERLSQERGIPITDKRGEGPVDATTRDLAVEAAALLEYKVMQAFARNQVKCVTANAVRATERGIIGGEDQLFRGKVDRIDETLMHRLLESEVIPVISPVAFNREGEALRINSDQLAADLAVSLKASKLIYLTPHPGLTVRGEFLQNIPVEKVERILEERGQDVDEAIRSKAHCAVNTISHGVPRAHILDGRVDDGLLTEIFSKVGIGTMIHGNEYQQIRRARRRDLPILSRLIKAAARKEELRQRSRQELEREIGHYFVYEIDDSLIGCAALTPFEDGRSAEVSAVYVQAAYQGQGVGKKLVAYACKEARAQGIQRVFALTTQSYAFFRNVCGFEDGAPTELPAARQEVLRNSGRNSRVLVKELA